MLAVVVAGLTCAIRPGRLHRGDLRTPGVPRRWGAALRSARRDPLSVVAPAAHAWSTAPSGRIAVLQRDGERVMVLSGEIDVHTVQTFEARTGSVGQAPSPTTPVAVVDPTAVTFIDCCGLGLLVRCTQSARDAGRHPILRGITPTGTASAPTDRPHDAVQHGPHLIRTRTSRRPPAPPSRV